MIFTIALLAAVVPGAVFARADGVVRPAACARLLADSGLPTLALGRRHRGEQRRGLRRRLLGPGVRYLTAAQMTDAEVFVRGGRLVDADGRPVTRDGLYVLTDDGRLIVRSDDGGELRHSSLAAGAPVFCAGFVRLVEGDVRWLDNSSGHYLPTEEHLIDFVVLLLSHGVRVPRDLLYDHQLRLLAERHGDRLPPGWR